MIKKRFFIGFCGFIGFFGLRYFSSGDVFDFVYVCFFAFFANFILSRIKGDKADERYLENQRNALAFTAKFAIVEMFVICFVPMIFESTSLAVILLPIAYAVTINLYAVRLYMLEEM